MSNGMKKVQERLAIARRNVRTGVCFTMVAVILMVIMLLTDDASQFFVYLSVGVTSLAAIRTVADWFDLRRWKRYSLEL
ncbi:hypothetical protein COU18_02970 [Candidatus Kaiserbacteria bacterium CG10_big_fil_rev_8_21_14_0_10_51_14]|uniref:Uncharacterized protein n=1 Tax=Candidatus Kaiserbacteria bacterium CG10_big_fil_rev_8_21_14_0_10_51_14 TaxID=1974610 RepID=A0A2H0UB34_9BACT|nr:MAG: hypothetical protein COU18_02970 [Candidatus Kaiserbacteria bacterium CG10_big_fil_rev_8_21_14_0_10_51_14]